MIKLMIKVPPFKFQQCLGPFTMLLLQGYSEVVLFYIYLTTFSEVRNFRNTFGVSVAIFWIWSKLNLHFKNAVKNSEKYFCFWDNYIWTGCFKYSLSRPEDLWQAVNVLTNNLKTLHIAKSDFFKLNCP